MTNLRFFKVLADSYQESEQRYITSEGRFDLSQDKGYQSSETGELRKVITGYYIKSLKLEEFELELAKEGERCGKEQYLSYNIGKSLGKFKIPLPVNEDGKLYLDSLDIIPANIIIYPNGEVKEISEWDIRNGVCLRTTWFNIGCTEHCSVRAPRDFPIKGDFYKLVDFKRL